MFFQEAATALKPEGILLFVEPSGHVTDALFAQEIETARAAGFAEPQPLKVRQSRAVALRKK
jgi:hypothetical protein